MSVEFNSDKRRKTSRKLILGEALVFVPDHFLNRSLFDLMVFPALANRSMLNLRQRAVVPAYSGTRLPEAIDTEAPVGIDATALITLNLLGLLEKVLDAFDTVYLNCSIHEWLSDEKRRIELFRQPNLVRHMPEVRRLIEKDMLEELAVGASADSELCSRLGAGLAILITEAVNSGKDDSPPRLVVQSVLSAARPANEKADSREYAHVLRSCEAVISALWRNGRITSETRKEILNRLRINERFRSDEGKIPDGAILYLDDLTIINFLRLGVLGELKPAGFRPFILPKTAPGTENTFPYKGIYDDINDFMEQVRSALESGTESGKIKIGQSGNDGHRGQLLHGFPSDCEAVIIDDRFVNRHLNICKGDAEVPVFSTLDLLDKLLSSDLITPREWLEYRTRLRNSGYLFVPIVRDELLHALSSSKVKDGKIAETEELRAIRENILFVQMSGWLQLPREWFWVEICLTAFTQALESLWASEGSDFADVRARADWIIDQVDINALSHVFVGKNNDGFFEAEFGKQVILKVLLHGDRGFSQHKKREYLKWIEDRILVPIKKRFPDFYSLIVGWCEEEVTRITERLLKDDENQGLEPSEAEWYPLQFALSLIPSLLVNDLVNSSGFRRKYGTKNTRFVSFGSPPVSVRLSGMSTAAKKVLSGETVQEVSDIDGKKWEMRKAGEESRGSVLELSREDRRCAVPSSFTAFSPDRETRLHFLEETADELNLPDGARDEWMNVFEKRVLEDDEFEAFQNDLADTPVRIRESVIYDAVSIPSLVPSSERYFDRLIGEYDGSATVRNYAVGRGRKFFRELSSWRPYEGFLFSLFLSSHSALTHEMQVGCLDDDDIIRAFNSLEEHGDRISQTGAIEVGLRILPSVPDIEPCLVHLVKQVYDDDVEGSASGFRFLSALFFFVDAELSRTRLLSTRPPFYRRLAALSHASLIQSRLMSSGVSPDLFHERLLGDFQMRHYMQSLVDMRVEPGWNPVFGTAEHIKTNCLRRIIQTAEEHLSNIKNSELYSLIFKTQAASIHSSSPFPYPPNPLDGSEVPNRELPMLVSDSIEKQIHADEVSPPSFAALVNSAYLFRLGSEHVELASKALRSCCYRISNIENRQQLLTLLNGLAMVAAVTRSHALANQLRILVRGYGENANYKYGVSAEEELLLCLTAAASLRDLDEWKEFVGRWITEMSFELEAEDAGVLRSQLQHLCHIAPDLWTSCAKACAVLSAVS